MDPTDLLLARRGPDGGFGPVADAPSEPEATAMVALALGDDGAAGWVARAQADDGSVGAMNGPVVRDVTPLATLVLRDPAAVAAGVEHVVASQARSEPSTPALPHDPSVRGWAWTEDTFGWVEPTSWAVVALRVHAEDGDALDDGLGLLRDRECVGGGWNYGNRIVLGEALPPYVQTTALALLALEGTDEPTYARGLSWLEGSWREEDAGLLSVAIAAAAMRTGAHASSEAAVDVVRRRLRDAAVDDTVALAWAAIALSGDLPWEVTS